MYYFAINHSCLVMPDGKVITFIFMCLGKRVILVVVAILRCRQFMESFIQFLWSSGVVMVSLMVLWRITFCSVSEAHIFSVFC